MIPVKNITNSGNYSDTMVQMQFSPIYDLFNTKRSKGITFVDVKNCSFVSVTSIKPHI